MALVLAPGELLVFHLCLCCIALQQQALQGEPGWASTGNWASTALEEGAEAAEMASSSGFKVLDGR